MFTIVLYFFFKTFNKLTNTIKVPLILTFITLSKEVSVLSIKLSKTAVPALHTKLSMNLNFLNLY